MSERVTMPALGESVTEGTVTRWLKNVGDTVAVDEPLLEVSTDKVDTEIPSPVAGVLQEILAQEDDTVPVGADLAVIGDAAEGSGGDDQPAQQDGGQDQQQDEQQASSRTTAGRTSSRTLRRQPPRPRRPTRSRRPRPPSPSRPRRRTTSSSPLRPSPLPPAATRVATRVGPARP